MQKFSQHGLLLAALLVMGGGLLPTVCRGDDPVFSGPQAGEPLPELPIQLVLDEDPSKLQDATAAEPDAPHQLVIFVHQFTRPSIAFTRTLSDYAASRKKAGLKTAVVFLGADTTALTTQLQRAKHALPKNVNLGVSPDGVEGPGSFGLNRNVTLTILVASEGDVKFNQALIDPSLPVELPKTLKAICDLVGGEPPTVDALLAKASGAEGTMRRGGNQPATQDQRPAGFDQVEPLLRRLIRKETSDADVDKLAKEIDEILKDHPAAQARLKEIATKVHKIYGSDQAQTHLRRWAEVEQP